MDGHPCSLSLIQTVTRHRPVLRLVLHVTIAIVKSGCGREICSLPLRLQHGRAAASAPIVPVERGPRFPFRTVGSRRTRPLSGAARDNGAYGRRQGKAVADYRSWQLFGSMLIVFSARAASASLGRPAVGMEPGVRPRLGPERQDYCPGRLRPATPCTPPWCGRGRVLV
jgi:hypothetical protein